MLDRKGEGERDRGAEGVRLHVRGWWFKSERPVSRARPKREQLIVMCGGRRGILIFPLNASPGGRSLSLSPSPPSERADENGGEGSTRATGLSRRPLDRYPPLLALYPPACFTGPMRAPDAGARSQLPA